MMSLGEFIDRVCSEKYKASIADTQGSVFSALGKTAVRYIIRTDSTGRRWQLPLQPGANADTVMSDDRLRSNCTQLGIDPADFGV